MSSDWANLESWFHLESDTLQNEDECSSDLSLTFPGSPVGKKSHLTLSLCCHCCGYILKDNCSYITTRKRADTVWKEEPFFFAAFLVVPLASKQEEKHKDVMTNKDNDNN